MHIRENHEKSFDIDTFESASGSNWASKLETLRLWTLKTREWHLREPPLSVNAFSCALFAQPFSFPRACIISCHGIPLRLSAFRASRLRYPHGPVAGGAPAGRHLHHRAVRLRRICQVRISTSAFCTSANLDLPLVVRLMMSQRLNLGHLCLPPTLPRNCLLH